MESALIDPWNAVDMISIEADPENLVRRIGNTFVQPISLIIQNVPRVIHLKLEGTNPTGSMKDRTGLALMQHVREQGRLRPDSIIIESTSGNLGVALALLSNAYHYQFLAIIDPKTTSENIRKMQALGAHIELIQQPDENGGYLLSRLARIQELCRSSSQYVWTDQYASQANPHIHYLTTGPEIYCQMHGDVDAVFVPVSTGGTLAGIGRYFREKSPATRIIGVDAWGSVAFGGHPAPRKLTGIGSSRPSSFLFPTLYDTHLLVCDEEAFAFCRFLFSRTGLKVGGSSGATLAACARYLGQHPELRHVVCVCADRGENYTSSIFNDDWLQEHDVQIKDEHLGELQDILLIHP